MAAIHETPSTYELSGALTIKTLQPMSEIEFVRLCQLNPDYRFEQSAQGELVVMSPTGGGSGMRNGAIAVQLGLWAEHHGGVVFDSSTMFRLPSGALRSPDASWIHDERWRLLSPEEQERFSPICPDFVIELRSQSDRVSQLQSKMQEWIDSGSRLAWLIDPYDRYVHVYRPQQTPEILQNIAAVSGDPELPDFELKMQRIYA